MFKLSLSKNLNRLDFLKAHLIYLALFVLIAAATVSPSLLLDVKQMHEFRFELVGGLLVAFALALYLFLLSICNITGRLRNISDRDTWALWGIYFVISLIPFLKIITILIFFLPTGYFNSRSK